MRQDHQTPGREIRGYGFSPHGCRACRPRHCTFSLSRIRRIADLKLSTAGLLCSTLSRRWIAVTWSSETPGHFPCRPDCGRRLTRSIFTLCDHQILTCLRFNLTRTTIVSGNGESRNTKKRRLILARWKHLFPVRPENNDGRKCRGLTGWLSRYFRPTPVTREHRPKRIFW